jgi:uncharacterized protein (TIGR02145 family)
MEYRKIIWFLILIIIGLSLCRCKTEEIILHGEINGFVTDTKTNQPLQAATVALLSANDSTTTGNDGRYLFRGLTPGNYDIKASKQGYFQNIKNASATSANTIDIDFALDEKPSLNYPHTLDFGFNLSSLPFYLSKTGLDTVIYILRPSKDWITIIPAYGEIGNDTDQINVTVNRTGLTQILFNEGIIITSLYRQYIFQDTINVKIKIFNEIIFNPDLSYGAVSDIEGNVYKTIAIGNQVWMAENLRTTKFKDNTPIPLVEDNVAWKNLTTPGCCWYNNDEETYKDIYGALYNWYTVNTGKLCPIGWHVPSATEIQTLITYLGGIDVAGGKMKETGTTHWKTPNAGATNSSGFTDLPGSYRSTSGYFFHNAEQGDSWSSYIPTYPHYSVYLILIYNSAGSDIYDNFGQASGLSVRCIKDLPGK